MTKKMCKMFLWFVSTQSVSYKNFRRSSMFAIRILPVGCVYCYRLPTHMSLVAFRFIVMMHIHMKIILSIYIRIMIYQCDGTTKALTNSIHCSILTWSSPSSLFACITFSYGIVDGFLVHIHINCVWLHVLSWIFRLLELLVFIMCLHK